MGPKSKHAWPQHDRHDRALPWNPELTAALLVIGNLCEALLVARFPNSDGFGILESVDLIGTSSILCDRSAECAECAESAE